MPLRVLGLAKDLRTDTNVIYAQVPITEYLKLIGDDFEGFSIQRRREKHKAYVRMRKDIIEGALLPAITLAVKPDRVTTLNSLIRRNKMTALAKRLSVPGHANILDGLQRTYILKDLETEGHKFKKGQTLLVEFWCEKEIKHLAYRMIILNAGQKPMSMRHQIELLFSTIRTRLQSQVPQLEIFTEREQGRRRGPRKFALDRLAVAYQCFLTQTPETQRDNIVAQQLIEAEALDSTEAELSEKFEHFVEYLKRYTDLDDEICRVYDQQVTTGGISIPTGTQWFGSENVMNSFFGAVAQFGSQPSRAARIRDAIDKLETELEAAKTNSDPMGLATLHSIIDGINPRKVNVGFATRRLITNGFKEFFRDSGDTSIEECWKLSSE
jgi:hypothetical protein